MRVAVLLLLLALPLHDGVAQLGRVVQRKPANILLTHYRLYEPEGRPVGLLVLLPGAPATVDEFNPDGSSPSTLPRRLASVPMVTIVPSSGAGSWLNEKWLEELDIVVAETLKTYELQGDRVVVGGFSGGGTEAVLYAQYCAAGRSRAGVRVRAVFAADAPLDLARLWRGETLAIRRGAHPRFVAEAKMVLNILAESLGGSPEEQAARYLKVSPVSPFANGGGQASLLRDVAIRLYTEPDVKWWMENRQVDYYSMNALDAAALVTELQLTGHKQAELITTHRRGFRPGGQRHPHSWSIIDEEDLAAWIKARVS